MEWFIQSMLSPDPNYLFILQLITLIPHRWSRLLWRNLNRMIFQFWCYLQTVVCQFEEKPEHETETPVFSCNNWNLSTQESNVWRYSLQGFGPFPSRAHCWRIEHGLLLLSSTGILFFDFKQSTVRPMLTTFGSPRGTVVWINCSRTAGYVLQVLLAFLDSLLSLDWKKFILSLSNKVEKGHLKHYYYLVHPCLGRKLNAVNFCDDKINFAWVWPTSPLP